MLLLMREVSIVLIQLIMRGMGQKRSRQGRHPVAAVIPPRSPPPPAPPRLPPGSPRPRPGLTELVNVEKYNYVCALVAKLRVDRKF